MIFFSVHSTDSCIKWSVPFWEMTWYQNKKLLSLIRVLDHIIIIIRSVHDIFLIDRTMDKNLTTSKFRSDSYSNTFWTNNTQMFLHWYCDGNIWTYEVKTFSIVEAIWVMSEIVHSCSKPMRGMTLLHENRIKSDNNDSWNPSSEKQTQKHVLDN